jgi:hypothetical protein
MAAIAALFVAVYAGSTEIGRAKLHLADTPIHATPPAHAGSMQPLDAGEGRQLAEAIRALASDRNRLAARLATVEHRVSDIATSVAHLGTDAWAAVPLPESMTAAARARLAPPITERQEPGDVTSSIAPHATETATQPAIPEPVGVRSEYGLDLGSGASVEALRTAWTAALHQHGALLERLHPIVHLRERPRSGGIELHLVAGPLPNATTAAQLCAAITAAGAVCQPAVFDGQRLAVR